jgi:hypothetical protein
MLVLDQKPASIFAKIGLILCSLLVTGSPFILSSSAMAVSALTGKQLRAELVGRWIRYQGVRTTGWYIYRNDGTVFVRTSSQTRTGGTWAIKGNKFCSRMKFRNYRLFCFTVSRLGKNHYKTSHRVLLFFK